MDRWAINVDIEGFGQTYDSGTQAMMSLRALMEGIYKIGSKCYPDPSERIFAHQLGDGFVVMSGYGVPGIKKSLGIAIFLMRHVLAHGGATKAAISQGDLADVQGCFPESIRNAEGQGSTVRMGSGLMTTFPVMGTAIINSIKLSEVAPSGSLLVVEGALSEELQQVLELHHLQNSGLSIIDWIHSEMEAVKKIEDCGSLNLMTASELESSMNKYIEGSNVKSEWAENTRKYTGLI